jgi:hypothetical protein
MRARVALLVASLTTAPVSWPAAAEGLPQLHPSSAREPGPIVPDLTSRTPGPGPAPAWDTFTADVTIRRRLIRKDGTPGPEAPEMRYRWLRTLGDGGWKTTMTVLAVSPDTIQTSTGPQSISRKVPVSRIEIGDARSPTRIFDAEGRMLFMLPTTPAETRASAGAPLPPQLEAVRVAAASFKASLATTVASGAVGDGLPDPRSRDWVDPLLPTAAGRVARRAAFSRDMGSPQGVVRGLERFVQERDGSTTEVLSDPAWSVPVEVNVVRGGALVSHSVLSYEEDPGVGLVRRRDLPTAPRAVPECIGAAEGSDY